MKDKRAKLLLITGLIALLTFNAAAQVDTTGPIEFLNDIAVEISSTDLLDWLDAESIWQLLVFLGIPLVSFYAMTRLIMTKGIEFMESNFRENTPSRVTRGSGDELSDLADWTAKVLSIGIATLTTIQYGGLFYSPTGILMIGVMGAILWAFLFGGFNLLFPSPLGWRPSVLSSTDGSDDAENLANEAEKAEESVAAEESEAESEEEAAEEDTEAGNTQRADQEANQAADTEQQAIEDMELAVQDVEKLMEIDERQLQNTINELNQTKDKLVYEEEIIEKLQKDLEETNEYLKELQTEYTRLSSQENPTELKNTFTPDVLQNQIPTNIENQLNEATALISRLADEVKENRRELSAESQEIDSEVKELIEAKKLLKKLKSEVEEGEGLDRRIEKLAEKLGDPDLYEEAEYEIQEEEKIENQLRTLFEAEEEIENALRRELEIIERLMEIDKQEIQELKEEDGEFGRLEEKLPRLVESLKSLVEDNREGPALFLVKEDPDNPGEITEQKKNGIIDRLNDFLSGEGSQLEEIKNSLEQIIQAKEENEKLEQDAANEIRNALAD